MKVDIKAGTAFNLCSEINSWLDLIVWCNEQKYEKAKEVAEQAFEDWHKEDTSEAFGDYLERKLTSNGIEAEIYWHQDKPCSEIDTDCRSTWEEYLGQKLTYEEYSEVDKHLDGMILDYDSKEEFENDFVWLYGYRRWSKKEYDKNEDDCLMLFLLPVVWLLEYFDNNEAVYKEFMSEYTAEDTEAIYSDAVLQDQVIFEKEA